MKIKRWYCIDNTVFTCCGNDVQNSFFFNVELEYLINNISFFSNTHLHIFFKIGALKNFTIFKIKKTGIFL